MALDAEDLVEQLSAVLLEQDIDGLDEDLVEYLAGLLSEADEITEESLEELMDPFLDSVACPPDIAEKAKRIVLGMGATEVEDHLDSSGGVKKLKQGLINMKLDTDLSEADEDANRFLWGTDSKVHEMTNTSMETQNKSSAKDRRKAKQDLEKQRKEFEAKMEQEQAQEGTGAVSAMLLPDYTSGRNEKDVQIKNVSLSLDNGRLLLDSAELKFASKRRYGLVGKVRMIQGMHHFASFFLTDVSRSQ